MFAARSADRAGRAGVALPPSGHGGDRCPATADARRREAAERTTGLRHICSHVQSIVFVLLAFLFFPPPVSRMLHTYICMYVLVHGPRPNYIHIHMHISRALCSTHARMAGG